MSESPESASPRSVNINDHVNVRELAAQLRVDSIRAAGGVGSGHVTSSLSAADLMAVLLRDHLCADWLHPGNPDADHLIFSKGHASPLLYAMFRAAGLLHPNELQTTYRRRGSRLEGHPTPRLPWVDVATGSLGQGLPIGAGIALALQQLAHRPGRVWVLCGDGELAEGSMWEAFDLAGRCALKNFTIMVDINRLGQSGPTAWEWDVDAYARRMEAFGVAALIVDGHDTADIDAACRGAEDADRPTAILARTVKGSGVPEIEDQLNWHGKALPSEMTSRAVETLGGPRNLVVTPLPARPPTAGPPTPVSDRPTERSKVDLPRFDLGQKVATRAAYGDALEAIGSNSDVLVLDGDVSNSTYSDKFAQRFPDRFFQMFIAENQMVAAAVGMWVAGYKPYASTFAAFLSRAFDFIRMTAISRADIVLCGSHAGVEIGEDGPSQMALEDLAELCTVHGSTVLYPADAVSCVDLVQRSVDVHGTVYLRTTRGAYPVLYESGTQFPVGGSKVLHRVEHGDVTIVAAGVTVHAALDAAAILLDRGISSQVVDAYSIKPLDRQTISDAIARTDGRLVVAEDHRPEGGLGSAVFAALATSSTVTSWRAEHCAVRTMPGSATSSQQLADAEIDADGIVAAALRLVAST